MIILLFLIIFSSHIYSAGFAGNTLLLTDQGQQAFDLLNSKILVQLDEDNFQPVLFLSKQPVEKVIQISIADEIITCHKKQVFWCVNKSNWICAQDLISGDLLKTIDEQYISIDAVQKIHQQTEIYSLTVGPPHHLYVSKHAVLAHNVVPFVLVAAVPFTSTLAVKVATTALGTGLVTFGAWIANWFAKNKNHKKPKLSVAEKSVGRGPVFFNPNDDDKNQHPHGIYEDADYHGTCQNGRKSARPKDGQKALDNSIPVQSSPDQRVAIEDGKIVTLQKTITGKYHGYVNSWKELEKMGQSTSQIRATLITNKIVSQSGKILS